MSAAPVPLRLDYLPAQCIGQVSRGRPDGALGAICFTHPAPRDDLRDPGVGALPLLRVDMAPLGGSDAFCEVWYGRGSLVAGEQGPIRYHRGESLLFGCLTLDEEGAVGGTTDPRPPLQIAAQAAYQAVFDLLDSEGYGSILRFWNYFPAINRVSHGIERYRQFNIGRQDAFLAEGRSVVGNVPAACALGSTRGRLQVAFLATRAEALCIENPRQVSAYHYPSDYGPRSPTFSRACLVDLDGHTLLFVSGTASIVGHQTLHPDDVAEQTRECLRNIAAILAQANGLAPAAARLDDLAYKVYLRHGSDLEPVRRELRRFVGAPVSAVFLQADICRADLLVEIEAWGGRGIPPPPAPGARP